MFKQPTTRSEKIELLKEVKRTGKIPKHIAITHDDNTNVYKLNNDKVITKEQAEYLMKKYDVFFITLVVVSPEHEQTEQ
jgi:hypothetical protein